MEEKLLEVEDVFMMKRRGLVITGLCENNASNLKVGDKIKIERPDKTVVFTNVLGIEGFFFNIKDVDRHRRIAFIVSDTEKNDVPKNSIIFLIK